MANVAVHISAHAIKTHVAKTIVYFIAMIPKIFFYGLHGDWGVNCTS